MDAYKLAIPDGLIGVPDARTFALEIPRVGAPFALLTCLDDAASWMELVVACDPFLWFPDYELELSDDDIAAIGVTDPEQVWALCTIASDPPAPDGTPGAVYANLAGPIVINRDTGVGRQVVLDSEQHRTRTPLPVEPADGGA